VLRTRRPWFTPKKSPHHAQGHTNRPARHWLVEPGIDSVTRLGRGVAARADDYEERRKFEESIGAKAPPPPTRHRLAKDRLADLMATATALELTKANKHGVLVLKTPLPSTVELFDRFVPTPWSRLRPVRKSPR